MNATPAGGAFGAITALAIAAIFRAVMTAPSSRAIPDSGTQHPGQTFSGKQFR
ncbi:MULTISPECIES: hypothetical protein [unclassified Cupriavidus]|uniref:hypothetical protein n=1 Tax=Cupriavidus sp. H19C3 TaxID=3241603 RepID=UPI003BF7C66F